MIVVFLLFYFLVISCCGNVGEFSVCKYCCNEVMFMLYMIFFILFGGILKFSEIGKECCIVINLIYGYFIWIVFKVVSVKFCCILIV